jgi:putative transposase
MPRPLRVHYPNACYHVMNRGAGHKKIFRNNTHRQIFLEILAECHETYNLVIYAYCLMDNHYHLLVSTPDANLSCVMKHLGAVYTQKFNHLIKSDGAVFRGRYKAKLVEEDCYRLVVSRYIHLNPVEAGIVEKPRDYNWSSYRAYISHKNVPKWLDLNTILKQLSETKLLSSVNNYQDYVEEKSINEINIYMSTKHSGSIIGSQKFKEKIISSLDDRTKNSCSVEVKRARLAVDMDVIKDHVCDFYKINVAALEGAKSGTRNLPKLIFMYLCKKKFGYPLHAIAQSIGFKSSGAVSVAVGRVKMMINDNPDLLGEVDEVMERIREGALDVGVELLEKF